MQRIKNALITYITAGDPNLATTEKLVYDLEKAGADIIELGIPFSDPLADGPVIQASHQRALKKDVSLAQVFKLVSKIRKKSQIPICFMLSYNLILQYGEDKFYQDMEKVEVSGVIIPDLPPEEQKAKNKEQTNNKKQTANILLIAPNSTDERIKLIAEKASGFIYLISTTGITGKRDKLAEGLKEVIERIRKYTDLPIAVGFGISKPAHAAEVCQIADGAIVGSAIVDLIAKKKIKEVGTFVKKLRQAIDRTV